MSEEWFAADVGGDFEESVRVDRAEDGRDHRLASVDTYHVTDEAAAFLRDFSARLLGRSEDVRSGANYWLYGHYGSGKSHLLSVLGGLMDGQWLRRHGRDDVWHRLVDGRERDLGSLESTWRAVHGAREVVPVSVNLPKCRRGKRRSFSELVLRAAHTSERLTGVEGGFSPRLDVAYFEDWYRTTPAWEERTTRTRAALDGTVEEPGEYDWADVQRYGALADVVLPALFEGQTGTRDGLDDLTPSDLGPSATVERLEELRADRESAVGRPVELVLLLDEVGPFVGTDFDRLTELQTLAESVDDVGDGDVHLVATARSKVGDVRPGFAARGADFGILGDRFPHRFGLSGRHVGEVAKRRLLCKTDRGRRETERVLRNARNDPETLLVYSNVEGNTDPPLDGIDREGLLEFYPFLPYQPPLFVEILANLRGGAGDPARSIRSGTARTVLGLVRGLLRDWLADGDPAHVVSLVDLYDRIEPELEDTTPRDVEVVDDVAERGAEGELADIDVAVAKAVVLLRHVPDTIPMTERNVGVAVLSDLDGPTQFNVENRVEESLRRLRRFVRPTHDDTGPAYGFADREERAIYERAEGNLADPDWRAVVESIGAYLWADVVEELSLPTSAEYGDTGERFPVRYEFTVDGVDLGTTVETEGALAVDIAVEGVAPEPIGSPAEGDPLEWQIGTEGIDNLRDSLVDWWALRDAADEGSLPESVDRDLTDRASRVRSKLVGALGDGTFSVRDRTDVRGPSTAVEEFVDVRYPDAFHPVMLGIDEEHLDRLRGLSAADPLPEWARRIQVATENPETHGGSIQNDVRAFAGRQLQRSDGTLAVSTVLDAVVSASAERYGVDVYERARPALRAVLWGLCRKGDFLPVDESGDSLPLDAVLDSDRPTTARLGLARTPPDVRTILEDGGFLESTDPLPDGVRALQAANASLATGLGNLAEDVELVSDTDVSTRPVGALLERFVDELEHRKRRALDRHEAVGSDGAGGPRSAQQWREVAEATTEARSWLDDARETWSLRLPELAQVDGQLSLLDRSEEWLTGDCEAAARRLRGRLEEYDGDWWTPDGREGFDDATAGAPSLGDAIEDAWASFEESTDVESFVDDLRGHPWVCPANELPAGVRPAFRREYLTPLRRLVGWYGDVSGALAVVTGDAASLTADDVARATDTLADTGTLRAAVGTGVPELRRRFERLRRAVGDRAPEDVAAVGLVPSDRDALESTLEGLAERGELTVERTEAGVIVR